MYVLEANFLFFVWEGGRGGAEGGCSARINGETIRFLNVFQCGVKTCFFFACLHFVSLVVGQFESLLILA